MFVGYLYLKFGKNIFSFIPFIKIKKVKQNTDTDEPIATDIDIILDKLKLKGWEGLSDLEKSQLYKASKDKQKHNSIN